MKAPVLGLSGRQARARLRAHGPNELATATHPSLARRFLRRLAEPLLLVLLGASLIAALTGDAASFGIVALIVLMSVTLDLVQEQRADRAVDGLKQSVALRVRVWRDGACVERPARELVNGDVVELSAGGLVPADGRVLEANDFFVNQALLTGEAFPVEKRPGAEDAPRPESPTHVFMGSSVVSGSARMQVVATGRGTELGRLAASLTQAPPPTAFERGTRRFGLLLTRWTMVLVLAVLFLNTLYHRPLLESFLFAVALAVGLTPELLPMIISVTLARGAVRLAQAQVIVKRLSSIQDLGAMDVLCTDKTGTLTEGRLTLEDALDAQGRPSDTVFELAWLNSHFETGVKSPLDDAILAHRSLEPSAWVKLDEVPFDFERRRVSVLLQRPAPESQRLLIVKGAPEDVLRLSIAWNDGTDDRPLDETARQHILQRLEQAGEQGLRLIAVARRHVDDATVDVSAADEHDFVFAGFIAFTDPPKQSAAAALRELQAHGVAVKVITGDNQAVTRHLCAVLGLEIQGVLEGQEIARLDDASLRIAAQRATLFCRVTPQQKSRLVQALQAGGRVVGFLGDGANDAPSLQAADVGISVDGAVDVAKQAADLVLLRNDLHVLQDGLREGRRTMINVDKYLLMAISSNFGNMVSMAAAAMFLPFLPMRPLQILLNNFLYDLSELALPLDRVRDEDLGAPKRWDIDHIRRFMLCFGPLSSLFDLGAFALLVLVFHAPQAEFQSAWFVESMATQVLVVFLIRTAGPAWRDTPSRWVVIASLGVAATAALLPFTAAGALFGFVPLPPALLAMVAGLTLGYLVCVELLKRVFYRALRPS